MSRPASGDKRDHREGWAARGAVGALALVAACGSEAAVVSATPPLPSPAAAAEASDAGGAVVDAAGPTVALAPPPVFRTATCTPPPTAGPAPLVVATDRGALRGIAVGPVRAFLGVPFAKAPDGALRFRAPVDVDCWTGVRDATKIGRSCVQKLGAATIGSEDCLSLNVWTPATGPGEKRPVIVFVHGGAEVVGSSTSAAGSALVDRTYDGAAFAERSGAVVVTANHRLGPLGFLAMPGLDAETPGHGSGNYALKDIVMTLEWVQANVAALGGDPTRVLIFGESSGALNTCAVLASPLARGRFSSALLMSGACEAAPLARRHQDGAKLATTLGCSGSAAQVVQCLRDKPAGSLMPGAATQVSFFDPNLSDPKSSWYLGWGPTVDGYVLDDRPEAKIRGGTHNHVPLVVGTTAHETELFIPPVINTCVEYNLDLEARFGATRAAEIRNLYPCADYGFVGRHAAVAWSTDAQFTCPARRIARAAAKAQTEPVFRYLYTHVAPGPQLGLRAFHGSELPLLFDTYGAFGASVETPGERQLTARMQGHWSALAGAGDPSASGQPWPRYELPTERLLVLAVGASTLDGWRNDKCDYWDQLAP